MFFYLLFATAILFGAWRSLVLILILATLPMCSQVITENTFGAAAQFYTNDIIGKFRIVVQGVTNEDVVYGETKFEVIKKK